MNENVRVLFLNGPPQSGKDTIVRGILKAQRNFDVMHEKLAKPLRLGVCALTGLTDSEFEQYKDTPLLRFGGKTSRDLAIAYFKKFLEPTLGEDCLGTMLLNRINIALAEGREWRNPVLIVISDSGRYAELKPTTEYFGKAQCKMIHVHRNGCDFEGDIRSYVPYHDVVEVHNECCKAHLHDKVVHALKQWDSVIQFC